MTIGSELFEKVYGYLSRRINLDALDMWLALHAQDLATLTGDDPMAQLAGLIQVTLAEMDDDVVTESDLRRRVDDFLTHYMKALSTRADSAGESVEFVGEDFTVSSTGYSLQPVEYTAA